MIDALDHLAGQFTFGLKTNRLGNACLTAPIRIIYPLFGKIEFTIDEGVSKIGDIVQKHGHLTVFDLSCCPTILFFDPC